MNGLPPTVITEINEALASLSNLVEIDGMHETFPEAALNQLAELGLQRFYIPVQQGGKLGSLTQLTELWRCLGGLDLTLAIAHGKTFLGSVCTWVAGSTLQKALVCDWVNNQQALAWGLTERDHGADLMSTQTRASVTPTGWRLNGEKWLINNATRGRAITVLARTSDDRGGRNLSLFLIDKTALAPEQFAPVDKIQTHGIRGADISGICLKDAEVPASALVGEPGSGLEITLKALQLTRIACCGLSLGALDGALGTVMRFAREHRLYGRPLIDLDTVRETLADALITRWISETTTWTAARVADCMPEELSVVSALCKGAVPSRIAQQLSVLEEQMGARGFVTDLPGSERFEKRIRDHQIVPIFDGSTLVSRASLVPHINTLVRNYRDGTYDSAGLSLLTQPEKDSEGIPFDRLTLLSRTGCSLVQAIPSLIDTALSGLDDENLKQELDTFFIETDRVINRLSEAPLNHPDVPFSTLHAIENYEWVFMGACCLNTYLNKQTHQKEFGFSNWLTVCLNRINSELKKEMGLAHPVSEEKTKLKEQLASQLSDGGA